MLLPPSEKAKIASPIHAAEQYPIVSAPFGTAVPSMPKSMEFVSIRPGSFLMGCSVGDNECYSDEKPAHQVTITRSFEIGKFPVTQGQYEELMGTNPSYFPGPTNPVEGVNWDDAQKFCEKFNARKDGFLYRLPTEAEWEYAARAGNAAPRYGELDQIAWHHGNSDGTTHPIGLQRPNAWGLFDTLGNVWEWVQDRYAADYYGRSPLRDPAGAATGDYRIARGGSWRGIARGPSRVSSRYILKCTVRSIVVGFRVARQIREAVSPESSAFERV
jgi:formylglycine-generating enzyme required for sulfatase activity